MISDIYVENLKKIKIDDLDGSLIPRIEKSAMPPKAVKFIRNPVYLYSSYYGGRGGRGGFIPPEYDISEIGRIEDTESYVAQSFIKKTGLMFKEGYSITGPNEATILYIKKRFRQIEEATGISFDSLLRDIGQSLIKKSNAFVIKKRKTESSGGKERVNINGKRLEPVAGYFVAPAESMSYKLDASGRKIVKWEHNIDGTHKSEFKPEDVIHIYYNRKDGFVFGTPTIIPVIDDIRALRKIEENIELLVYQHLFPLFHYKVGTENNPAGYTEDGRREIDVVKSEIMNMPAEGGIVTPERHEISFIGSEGRALRADGYLEHFKKRVFTGLGVSAVDMGEGDTMNRATADNMSRNLVDAVKDFQRPLENQFNEKIIRELLQESNFSGIDPLDEENFVTLRFNEIDIDAKIKKENHLVDMFLKNGIPFNEMRLEMGRLPVSVPTVEEIVSGENLETKYPSWYQMYWKLIEEPKALIQAIDEPYSAEARTAAKNRSLELGQAELDGEQMESNKNETSEKTTPGDNKDFSYDLFFCDSLLSFKLFQLRDTATECSLVSFSPKSVMAGFKEEMMNTKDELLARLSRNFYNGYSKINASIEDYNASFEKLKCDFEHRLVVLIDRTVEDIEYHLNSKISLLGINSVIDYFFDLLREREEIEMVRALLVGEASALFDLGAKSVKIILKSSRVCKRCSLKAEKLILADNFNIDEMPPYHLDCKYDLDVGE